MLPYHPNPHRMAAILPPRRRPLPESRSDCPVEPHDPPRRPGRAQAQRLSALAVPYGLFCMFFSAVAETLQPQTLADDSVGGPGPDRAQGPAAAPG
eukprot:57328-Hanusia_phi.AAC.1